MLLTSYVNIVFEIINIVAIFFTNYTVGGVEGVGIMLIICYISNYIVID